MDFQSNKAIYLQIADYICELILLRKWQAQDKIPSVREFAIELGVNPNTIMRTYSYLEEKNIIATQRGIGYFVLEGAHAAVMELRKKEFLEMDLPRLFQAMKLLNINFENLKQFYDERVENEKK